MQNRTQSTNPWFNQVYPTECSVGQAHSSACTLCSLSLLFYYIRPSSILNSPRFHAYCCIPSFCLSRASPGLHFFPSLLFSGSFVQCAQLFLQFLTFPIPGRSIIIALNGDVQPRIKTPFPFQNAHNPDSPLLRQPITPTAHYSDGPFFRQCKIELNPQIHGLTRYIQQDVPSVRLILTDHGLDRMFWKGKGVFILGCTSPFKAIMIDRPGMGDLFPFFCMYIVLPFSPFLLYTSFFNS
jgi:hypothetical protein